MAVCRRGGLKMRRNFTLPKRKFITMPVAASLALAVVLPSFAQEADPAKIIRNSQQAFFYQAESFRARVKMTLTSASGNKRLRELTMLRLNMPKAGDQRY